MKTTVIIIGQKTNGKSPNSQNKHVTQSLHTQTTRA